MLNALVRFSIKQHVLVILGALALWIAGIWSYYYLPVEAFPDVLNVTVQVITLVPGQSAEDIELRVTKPLEKEFSGTPKVTQTRSISEFGLSVIYLTFDDGVDKYWARTQVLEKIADAPLSPEIQPYLAAPASVTGEVFRYELIGDGFTPRELRTIQDWSLEKYFRSIPGVADVVGYGGEVRTWEVQVDPLKLANFDLSMRQVVQVVQSSNMNAGGNLINWPNQSFVVRAQGQYKSKDDILDLGVGRRGNSIIRIRDIGDVIEGAAPVRGVVGRDGKDSIVQGIVLLRKGENPTTVGRSIREGVEQLKKSSVLPRGVKLEIYYDRLQLVAKTTKTVGKNLLEGLFLVALILYVFLRNKKITLLVGAIVPLSMSFAFVCLMISGTPANLISLGSIDFGIIVDGAVIIVEYVLTQLQLSQLQKKRFNLEKSIVEVVRPVFFSMTTVILAYLPILTLERVEGKMFRPLAITLCFALTGALILSLTLIPALLPKIVEAEKDHPHQEPPWLTKLIVKYEKVLDWCFQYRKKFLQACAGTILVGILCLMFSGSEFLPELDEGALWIRVAFPHSTSIEEGTKLAKKIRAAMKEQEEVKTVVSQLGGPEDGTDPNLFDNCEFFAELYPKETWKRFGHDRIEFVKHMRGVLKQFPGMAFNISQPIADNVEEAITGVKGKNAAKIFGPDLKVLNQISTDLVDLIKKIPGTVDVAKISVMPEVPHLTISLDRAKVAQAGLNVDEVDDLVETAVGGKAVTQVYDGEARLDVMVRAPKRFRASIDDIRSFPVALPSGGKTTLDRLARIKMVSAPQVIQHENGFRRIGVKFDVEGRDFGSTMHDILKQVKHYHLPPGYFMVWGGEYENHSRANKRMAVILPATLLLLGLILFFLYENLWTVSAVMINILVSCMGAFILLFLRGMPLSVSSSVGLIALFGIMSLDGVTLASSVVRESDIPFSNWMAKIKETCLARFRPIFMNSILAALGLLPAAISKGVGSETQRPLATVVIGGLMTGVPATLFFLPFLLYVLKERVQPEPETLEPEDLE